MILRLTLVLGLVLIGASACGSGAAGAPSTGGQLRVVAAENFYGDVAKQLGGDHVAVVSILEDPSADPHEYETSPDDAKAVGAADVVVKNGLGYDAFIDKLMASAPRSRRQVVDAGELSGHTLTDNPHIWYELSTMRKVAQATSAAFSQLDPANQAEFASRLSQFEASLHQLQAQVDRIKAEARGARVLSTEPVFDYMAMALGLTQVNQEGDFQRAIEQGNDPPARAVAEFRTELTSHAARALIFNSQTVTPITKDMQDLAKQNGIPVVGVSETEPAGKTYQQWMTDELDAVAKALAT